MLLPEGQGGLLKLKQMSIELSGTLPSLRAMDAAAGCADVYRIFSRSITGTTSRPSLCCATLRRVV
jgi:hypothetical protein